jgi:hypothetical protein
MLLEGADLGALAGAYAEDQRLRAPNAMANAEGLAAAAEAVTAFDLMVTVEGRFAAIPPERLAAIPDAMRRDLQASLHREAAQGQGFAYEGLRLGEGRAPAPLEALLRAVNERAVLDRIEAVTGERVTRANGQLTRYRPGHYLTRHRDDPEGETRRLAYVLSLTRAWHPDQGGLLMFYTDDGQPRDAWIPALGTLSLFSVRHVHSVTVVSPFAPRPRLSVTGWFSA